MAGKPRDRIGERYGRLVITEISDKRSKAGAAYWNGICDCGQIRIDIPGDQLFHGSRRSRNSVCCCLTCARSLQSDASKRKNSKEEDRRRKEALARRTALALSVPKPWLELPLTEQEGREKGSASYFNGLPCDANHLALRRVDGGCRECERLRMASWRSTPEGQAATKAASRARWVDPSLRDKKRASRAAWAQTEAGKQKLRESYKSFYENNRDRLMKERTISTRMRYNADPVFRLRRNLARRVKLALEERQTTKDSTTRALVGCDLSHLIGHIESQFSADMNWKNMGQWHVDHVRPCASFDLSIKAQQLVCFNWRNLQPLDGEENYKKKDKYEPADEVTWAQRMRQLGFDGELFTKFT